MIEQIRRAVRGAIGYDSTLYRLVSQVYTLSTAARREGIGTAIQMRYLESSKRRVESRLDLASLAHPIWVREGTPDIPTVINTVVRQEYGRDWAGVNPLRMIDAGAYIGDTSAYFLSRFSDIAIVALEPNSENFAMARRNLAPYGARVRLLNNALDAVPGIVRMSGEHLGAAIVSDPGEEDAAAIEATSVPEILNVMGWSELDLLKMDIEGGEAVVLDGRADAWLPRVRRVILEPHGTEIEAKVRDTLTRNGFAVERYRSLLYAVRPRG